MSGKRHHFIPQFLQRGFVSHNTNKDIYTWVKRKGYINPFNTNIKNIGTEGFFYSNEKEATLDDIITGAENEFAQIVDELRQNNSSSRVDNKKAAKLIAHLESRTKNLRDSFRNAGTLLLVEITNYLQDANNCEKFVKKQVAAEAGKMIEEELEKRNIPRTLFPIFRQQFAPVIKEKIPEMTNHMSNMMMYVSQNISSLLEKSVKTGHIKALLNNHTPPIKVSAYEKLYYQVVSTGDLVMPLGDSAVIFNIEGDPAFKPYFEIDNKLLSVILPISSSKLLVGSTKSYQLKTNDIPEAIARCSLDYFISSEQNADNEALAKHISKNATMISESEIEDILSDLMMNN
jgi:hypothetical protein